MSTYCSKETYAIDAGMTYLNRAPFSGTKAWIQAIFKINYKVVPKDINFQRTCLSLHIALSPFAHQYLAFPVPSMFGQVILMASVLTAYKVVSEVLPENEVGK